jgi:GNAT superfamily N-acetyltransferase
VTVEVRRVLDAEEIRPLRRDVLRPGGTLEPTAYDLDPVAIHIGAFDDGVVVGCASLYPEAYRAQGDAWRLRGMAVQPARQGRGIGASVLLSGTAAALEAGAPLIWATARVTAMSFYLRLGWQSVGDEFEYGPARLPHLLILWRPASAVTPPP